jgi:hypothetical protein
VPNVILTFQAGHFGQAQACLHSRQQQRVIPSAIPGALIRRIQKCVDFRARDEVDQLAVKALVGMARTRWIWALWVGIS